MMTAMQAQEQPLAFRLLHTEHERIDALLGEVMAGQGDIHALQSLCQQLEQHMAVEEQVFYPALARLEMLESFVDLLQDQHRIIRENLQAVLAIGPGGSGFEEAVRRLDEEFDRHVEDEESRAFAYAAQHLADELDALAVEMDDARDAARGAYGVG